MRRWLTGIFETIGEIVLFALRAIRDFFRPPFEAGEILRQAMEVGWRSTPLVVVSGFAIGVIVALETRASMVQFGAEALIPQAVTVGIFKDMGPLLTALLLSGRAGAGIGAQLAGMRVTEQIDALEALAVDSFKFLVVTRIVACILVLPVLTTFFDFAGLAGGMLSDVLALHVSTGLFVSNGFAAMGWHDYIVPTVKTVVFGFLIGTLSCYLGYTATQGAAGVGRASTRSVVYSSLLVILSDAILVKLAFFLFP